MVSSWFNVATRICKDIEVQTEAEPVTIDSFLKTVANEAKSHVTHTSLHGLPVKHKK